MLITIVIPAYNEASRLPRTLRQITEFLATQVYDVEIVVVDDGSTDNTTTLTQEFAAHSSFVKLLRMPHKGKGHAVKAGVLQAQGEYVFLCDADLSMPITELPKFLPPLPSSYKVAIGSREASGAARFDEPVHRHLMGRVFNGLVQLLAVPGLKDTQCGFKCFHHSVVKDLFSYQTLDGFGFDVEVLYLAQRRGYRIVEVPIQWYYQTESKVHPWRDTYRMVLDILRIRYHDFRGRYGTLPTRQVLKHYTEGT
jgi:glycosyltransferase involved in cell wall biosynthesis